MANEKIGFIGLGNIGKPIADNIAKAGFHMIVFDIAGTAERAPKGAESADSVSEVALRSDIITLSLPSVAALNQVIGEICRTPESSTRVVVNTSTVGPEAALTAHARLSENDIDYVDAPVSGNKIRSHAGELTIMFSGKEQLFSVLEPLFNSFGANIFNIGTGTGQGQRMKLLNNSLVAASFVSTSEALAYGEKGGIDMATMLDVINVSSGQNFVSQNVFPHYVLTETYDSAGATAIIRKDASLFVESAQSEGASNRMGTAARDGLQELDEARPGLDQTYIYPFIRDKT